MTAAPGRELTSEFLDAAVEDQAKAARLLVEHPNLRHARWLGGESCLHFLAVEDYLDAVRFLGRHGFDVNAANRAGDTALMDAVYVGNTPMVEVLLGLGANANLVSGLGSTPLQAAVAAGRSDLVTLLLEAGALLEVPGTLFSLQSILQTECPPTERAHLAAVLDSHHAMRGR